VSSARRELLNIINIFSRTLSSLTEEQFDKLLSNSARLEYAENEVKEIKPKLETPRAENNTALEKAASIIEKLNTREEAKAYIDNLKMKKEELIYLGKLVNANISSKESKAVITDKIVEATVGANLRSKAISGIDLRGKSTI
jgi:hypothetical protein